MKSKFILSVAFACIGITTEIIFTGIKYNIAIPIVQGTPLNWELSGTSYIWMAFIYGLVPFIFPPVYAGIRHFTQPGRLCIYAALCLLIEFLSGALLDAVTGNCPWQYTTGWQIAGYIRLDYFPLWMGFGWLIEITWKRLSAITW